MDCMRDLDSDSDLDLYFGLKLELDSELNWSNQMCAVSPNYHKQHDNNNNNFNGSNRLRATLGKFAILAANLRGANRVESKVCLLMIMLTPFLMSLFSFLAAKFYLQRSLGAKSLFVCTLCVCPFVRLSVCLFVCVLLGSNEMRTSR